MEDEIGEEDKNYVMQSRVIMVKEIVFNFK